MTLAEIQDRDRRITRRRASVPDDRVAAVDEQVIINLRAPATTRNLIDHAAGMLGKTRTDFMLDSASRAAQDVLLDQRLFLLEPERFDAVMDLLDNPPAPNEALKRLMRTPAPWEE